MLAVPFKANAARRHRIPRQRHRVTDWAEYDAALRQRGSLTVWFTDEAVAAWRGEARPTPGGQPPYSPLATPTAPARRARGVTAGVPTRGGAAARVPPRPGRVRGPDRLHPSAARPRPGRARPR